MKAILAAILLFSFSSLAVAQDVVDGQGDVLLSADICDVVRKYSGTAEVQDNFNISDTQGVVGFPIEIPLQLDLQNTQFSGFLPNDINTESVLTSLSVGADGSVSFQGRNVRFVPDEFCNEHTQTDSERSALMKSEAAVTNDKNILNAPNILSGSPSAEAPVSATIVDRRQQAEKPTRDPVVREGDVPRVPTPKPEPVVSPKTQVKAPAKKIIKQDVDLVPEKGEILEGRAN